MKRKLRGQKWHGVEWNETKTPYFDTMSKALQEALSYERGEIEVRKKKIVIPDEQLGNSCCPNSLTDAEILKKRKVKEREMRRQIKNRNNPEPREVKVTRKLYRRIWVSFWWQMKLKDIFKEMAKQPKKSRIITLKGK